MLNKNSSFAIFLLFLLFLLFRVIALCIFYQDQIYRFIELLKMFLNFLVISFSNPPLILPLKDIRYHLKCEIVIDILQHNNRSNNFTQFTPVTVLLFFLHLLTFSFPISFLLLRKFNFFCLF